MGLMISDMRLGQMARLKRTFNEDDVKRCSELTKDYSPIYQQDKKEWRNQFSRPVVPGLLTEGLINQVISEKLPGRACILLQKELVFYHPVYIGDTVTAELEVIDINIDRNWVTQKIICYNESGTEIIKGQLLLLVIANEDG